MYHVSAHWYVLTFQRGRKGKRRGKAGGERGGRTESSGGERRIRRKKRRRGESVPRKKKEHGNSSVGSGIAKRQHWQQRQWQQRRGLVKIFILGFFNAKLDGSHCYFRFLIFHELDRTTPNEVGPRIGPHPDQYVSPISYHFGRYDNPWSTPYYANTISYQVFLCPVGLLVQVRWMRCLDQ